MQRRSKYELPKFVLSAPSNIARSSSKRNSTVSEAREGSNRGVAVEA